MVHALTGRVVARSAGEAHGDTAGAEAPGRDVLQRDLSPGLDGCSLESSQAYRAAVVAEVVEVKSLVSKRTAAHCLSSLRQCGMGEVEEATGPMAP